MARTKAKPRVSQKVASPTKKRTMQEKKGIKSQITSNN
jgi:hypothetical protein